MKAIKKNGWTRTRTRGNKPKTNNKIADLSTDVLIITLSVNGFDIYQLTYRAWYTGLTDMAQLNDV